MEVTNVEFENLKQENLNLQNKVTELEKVIEKRTRDLQLADEMQQELLQVKSENWMLKTKVDTQDERSSLLDALPRLVLIRDSTLNKLKVGRQSTAGKAINAFIKELEAFIPESLLNNQST